ncbi:preprotein translocase subunit SecF [Clostridium acetobutylicum]|uniref:Protein-export membrane protein SecF n=1 Tax=Clostridium acetobutylicum (strain ATCC 824 / DSM 792 / JCM 1419 / IAM 19013 / LMG 5710 / NBRC 13948 / NRRL B-527 / VKM B-1787 / 2291 / W) TaxID=272562 RepID=Q97GT8_CLOAB|nr:MULTISPECIES: protein translocase subunit SecF [Clostridium]AAK80234.1 Preprotein translocase subunit SecF [Clostridium acetobutylicum ATCC 824]ADZ21329.1 preprotein translocase subunit SecF [Clostridium acetobutylicum EA 2018]AEI34256.1 preprotein translocase subunit SecF [Clostridium acetobutylicum DSM 1731]AWV79343.1 protein translocase subunit SecF [Clostridium acetobutylicum]MBC2394686.1 protein translocase subunit SecF [Clostridium acetobutylicum]
MLKVIKHTKVWFGISLTIIFLGIAFMIYRGVTTGKPLEFGIDFVGGNSMDIKIGKSFNKTDVEKIVDKYIKDSTITTVNNTEVEIKSSTMTDAIGNKIFKDMQKKYNLKSKALVSQEKIGGTIGQELKTKALIALAIALVIILLYIAWRFEFKFGVAAMISLVHDVLVTLAVYGIFAIPLNSPFIAGMLTIVGYSMSDTIVVFDRIRENSRKHRRMSTSEIADFSINETLTRSIYTVLTVLIAVSSVHVFVPSVRDFTKPLLVGIVSGCYSSIFIASPLWVIFKERANKKKLQIKAEAQK